MLLLFLVEMPKWVSYFDDGKWTIMKKDRC